ncbi:MAG: electron transfer flavoprotein subunit beta/FixA family protein [Chloroflexi bacterium]|nr:electron transfer flavoprotein subunit beta/FixA family protein [Chloroflexota bacterium]
MNIAVCLKQVPGTTKVEIDPQTNTLVRQGIENIVNPFDTYALEEGVRLRERYGGKVTAISMGPPQAEAILRDALATGADEAVLLSDAAFAGADTWATAYTLSRAVDKLGPCDIVICGRQTIDGDTGQVGPELAEILGFTFVSYVSQVEEIDGEHMRLKRLMGERYEILEALLPAVITVVKEINTPRLPSLRGMAKAKSATIPVWGAEELEVDGNKIGLTGSATRVIKVFFPQRTQRAEILEGELPGQVDYLIDRLREANLI